MRMYFYLTCTIMLCTYVYSGVGDICIAVCYLICTSYDVTYLYAGIEGIVLRNLLLLVLCILFCLVV